jgi:hypothetical protein
LKILIAQLIERLPSEVGVCISISGSTSRRHLLQMDDEDFNVTAIIYVVLPPQTPVGKLTIAFQEIPDLINASQSNPPILNLVHLPPIGVVGDPQFVGFHQQKFQVHGIDGEIYNLISLPTLQLNARFTFLSEGNCVPHTISSSFQSQPISCWSHPGSYLGEIGIRFISEDSIEGKDSVEHTITLSSGNNLKGFSDVLVDDKRFALNSSHQFKDVQVEPSTPYAISYPHTHFAVISTPWFTFTFESSDMFINQRVTLNMPLNDLENLDIHGILGQTVHLFPTHPQHKHKGKIKYIEGDVDDYVIGSTDLLGDDFIYNRYRSSSSSN